MIYVGCSGFPVSRKRYYREMNLVELQETFYNINIERLRKLKEEAPEGFKFTMKAWQVVTHKKTSPTWRKLRKMPEGVLDNYGYLMPTHENLMACKEIRKAATILGSKILIFQLPPSLKMDQKVYEEMKKFFSKANFKNYIIGVEPRNKTWYEKKELMEELFFNFNIVHVVDIFKRHPIDSGDIFYLRLHGLNGEINYRYRYNDKDLRELKRKITELEKKKDVYVLFNNIYMFESAKIFLKYL